MVLSMKYGIAASTWANLSRAFAAAAIATWLAFAICPAVFAADGRASRGSREASGSQDGGLSPRSRKIERPTGLFQAASFGISQAHFRYRCSCVFTGSEGDDFGWLLEWVASVDQTYIAMIMFGAKNSGIQTAGRNLVDYQDNTLPAAAFKLRLNAHAVSAMPIYLNSLPPGERAQARGEIEQSNRGLVQMATGMAGFIGIRSNWRTCVSPLRRCAIR